MKSQMDWIVSIVAFVLAAIAAGTCYMMRPQVRTIAEPEKVIVAEPKYPEGAVTFANSLPSGSGGGGAQGGMGGPSGRGGMPMAPPGGGGMPSPMGK